MSDQNQVENTEIQSSDQDESPIEVTPIDLQNSRVRFIPLELNVLTRVAASLPTIVPNVSMVINQAGHWLVKFSPEVAKSLSSGNSEMIKAAGGGFRATAVSNGRFAGNATLTKGIPLNPAQVTTLLWSVATAVTAQKHLADVSTRLQSLENKIDAVKHHLEVDDWAKLGSCVATLEDLRSITQAGIEVFNDPLWSAELLLAERTTREVAEKYRGLLERRHVAPSWHFVGTVDVETLKHEFAENQHIIKIALWASALHISVLTALPMVQPLDASTIKQKWNRHRKALDALYIANRDFTEGIATQLPGSNQISLGGVFDDLTAKMKRQQHIPTGDRAREELEKYNRQFEERIQLLRSSLDATNKRLENPIRLLIERDSNGELTPIGLLED
jgi:hypothetical protein